MFLQKPAVQRLKTAEKEIIGLHSAQAARSCCLPTERRRSNSRGSLRVVSGLAENTNSIFCDGPSGPETVNGCPVLRRQEPLPRGTRCGLQILNMSVLARSSVARVRRTVFSLDNDLPVEVAGESPPDVDHYRKRFGESDNQLTKEISRVQIVLVRGVGVFRAQTAHLSPSSN